MRIALAQINTTVGDFAGNAEKILTFARQADERRADWVVFPELAVCGYPPRDLLEKPAFLEKAESEVQRLAERLPADLTVLLGYVRPSRVREGKPAADAAALLRGGRVLLDYTKILLPTYDVFDEGRYFEPGCSPAVYESEGNRVAVTICEDIWNDKNFWEKRLYKRDPVEEAVGKGANFLVNLAASPFAVEKPLLREQMLRRIAVEYRLPVVYVNQVGGNDSLIFDGSSLALDAEGRVRARARSFAEDLVIFDTEGDEEVRPGSPSEIEAVHQALILGTRDYVRKCGFEKGIVGLSGGIDSSVVASLAADALGPENVLGVAMPGPYSSPESLRDAQALAANLGIQLHVVPITPLFEGYLTALEPVFRDLPRDVTEENIQARIRGNILMALSNKFGALLLSTGNKSELAAGYCTLYGDMAGGLTVISDVPKTMVYELARAINREQEIIPQACLDKAPSAELRPNQTDQDSLPPYDVLDAIVHGYIEENLSAKQIERKHGLDSALVAKTVRQLNRAEYKRQQAPPGLKVTAKAFGIGRRYPIAQKFLE